MAYEFVRKKVKIILYYLSQVCSFFAVPSGIVLFNRLTFKP